MCDEKPDNTQLRLYAMLVDQLHRTTTILWQFPTALLAANAFALDKFLTQPLPLLFLGLFDATLTYAYYRVRLQQCAIIEASRAVEEDFKKTSYQKFIPEFDTSPISGPFLIVSMLWIMSFVLIAYSLVIFCYPCLIENSDRYN